MKAPSYGAASGREAGEDPTKHARACAADILSKWDGLEFILESNSYVFEVVKPEGISRLEDPDRRRYFEYQPDFWANRLDDTVPIAELFRETRVTERDGVDTVELWPDRIA